MQCADSCPTPTDDGTLYAFGDGSSGQTTIPRDILGIVLSASLLAVWPLTSFQHCPAHLWTLLMMGGGGNLIGSVASCGFGNVDAGGFFYSASNQHP